MAGAALVKDAMYNGSLLIRLLQGQLFSRDVRKLRYPRRVSTLPVDFLPTYLPGLYFFEAYPRGGMSRVFAVFYYWYGYVCREDSRIPRVTPGPGGKR